MQDRRLRTLTSLLFYSAGIGAAVYVIMFIVVALLRISYPFELEWMEGVSVDHVQRILDGKLLYVAPSVSFIPTIYTPLYYYISAGAAMLLGNGFVPLRLVSLLASLGSMLILYAFARRETRNHLAGLIAAGLYAGTYYLTGAWLDIARVDSLFVFFLLATLWMLRFHPKRAGYMLAAALATLAFMTKQTGLIAAVFFMIYAVRMRKEHGWYFIGAFLVFMGITVALMDRLHDGWFTFYVLEVPAKHPVIPGQFLKFWAQDIFHPLPLAAVFGLAFVVICWLNGRLSDVWFYVLCGVGFLGAAGAPRIKDGNYVNDLIPAYAFIALLFGIAIPALRTWARGLYDHVSADYPARARTQLCLACLFPALILIQLLSLAYGPQNQIPTSADRKAGEMLVKKIAEFKGDVWVTNHGYLTAMAGKPAFAMSQPYGDVIYADNKPVNKRLQAETEQALRERRFAAVITDDDDFLAMAYRTDYEREPVKYAQADAFWPITDYQTRPTWIYIPRDGQLSQAINK